jgi:hypothetical protein
MTPIAFFPRRNAAAGRFVVVCYRWDMRALCLLLLPITLASACSYSFGLEASYVLTVNGEADDEPATVCEVHSGVGSNSGGDVGGTFGPMVVEAPYTADTFDVTIHRDSDDAVIVQVSFDTSEIVDGFNESVSAEVDTTSLVATFTAVQACE